MRVRRPIGSSGKRPISYARDRVAPQRATEMRSASVRLRTPLAPEVWAKETRKNRRGKMLRGAFRHCGVITAIASLL